MTDNSNNEEKKNEELASESVASDGSNSPASEVDVLKSQLQKSQNDFLYLRADFENYKKRAIKERSDLLKYGGEPLVRSLLDLLDNFERALSLSVTPENIKSFCDGIQMIHSEFKSTLSRHGISEMEALGKMFDPNIHEALGSEPTTEFPAGSVSKVFSKPYKLHDRLIRPAKVIIADAPKEKS